MNASTAEATELRRLHSDLFWTEKGQFVMAGAWQSAHLIIGLVATGASAAAGVGIVAEKAPVLSGLAALLAAVAAAVLTFIKPEEVAGRHLAAGRRLGALRVEIRQTLNLDLPRLSDTPELRERLSSFARQKFEIEGESPHVSNLAMKIVERRIKQGEYGHEPDLTEGG